LFLASLALFLKFLLGLFDVTLDFFDFFIFSSGGFLVCFAIHFFFLEFLAHLLELFL